MLLALVLLSMQANPQMPRTFGNGEIHVSHIDTMFFSA